MKRRLLSVIMAAMLAVSCAAPLVYAEEITDEVYLEETEDYTDYASDDAVEEIYTEETEPAYESDELEAAEAAEGATEAEETEAAEGATKAEETEAAEESTEAAETELTEVKPDVEYLPEEESTAAIEDENIPNADTMSKGESPDINGSVYYEEETEEASEERAFGYFYVDWTDSEYTRYVKPNEERTLSVSIEKENDEDIIYIRWYYAYDFDYAKPDWIHVPENDDSLTYTFSTDRNMMVKVECSNKNGGYTDYLEETFIVSDDEGKVFYATTGCPRTIDLRYNRSRRLSVTTTNTYNSTEYYEWRRDGELIDGACEDYYDAELGGNYTVRVYDDLGHEKTFEFEVLDTQFRLRWKGLDIHQYFVNSKGEGTVEVVSLNDEIATTKWYTAMGEPGMIENESLKEDTEAEGQTKYSFVNHDEKECLWIVVECTSTNNRKASINLYAYPSSGEEPVPDDGEFEVTTDLEDWELDMWDSDSMELTVNVESTYDSAVSYEWRKNGEIIEGAADDSYTATEGGLYTVRAYDDLGHEGTVDFKVSAERDIGAGWTCGEDIEAPANQELKLSVDTTGITKDVTFSWTFHDIDSIEPQEIGEGSSELIIGADDLKSGAYVCEVSDGYNYQRIYYSVAVINHLSAVVEHPDENTDDTETVAVPYGKTARLKAIVTADDMDGIVYKWIDNNPSIEYDVNEDTIEIENITEARFIQLKVTDKYGNNKYLYYNIRVDNHFTVSAEEQKVVTYKYVPVYNAPLTLKVYAKADDMEGLTYRWFDEDEHNLEGGTKSSVSIGLDKLKMMAPGKKKHYVCEVTDKFGSWTRVVFRVEMKKLLVFDKTALTIGLTKTGTVNATMAATDKIVNVVPSNKNVATATWSGNKITVKAGTVGGSTNIAVKTASGKVVKFKVTVPKPVLSFTSGSKAISMTSALDLKKSKSAIVTAKLADGDSIAKVAPSNKCVTCKWSGNKITVTAGKAAGAVNVAVKTKCGKVVKFKVNVK